MNSRIAINCVFFINGLLFANWAARIPQIQDYFNLDYKQMGTVLLASAIGSVVGMPTAGFIINKYGSRKITLLAATAYIFSIPLYMLSPNYYILILGFLFMGYSVGMLDVAMNDQAVEIEKRRGSPIMTFFHALFSAGMMVGAGTGILFNALDVGLLPDFIIMSSIGLLLLLFVYPSFVDHTIESYDDNPLIRIPSKTVLSIGLIAFCCMLGEGAMSDWTSQYMLKVAKSSEVLAPAALMGFSIAMMMGRFVGDRLRILWGDNRLMITGGILAFAGVVIAVSLPYPILVVLSAILIGLGLSTIVPIAYSLAGNLPGLGPGVGISMVTTIGYSGFLFGPPIIGFIADTWSLRIAFVFLLFLFALMLLLTGLRYKAEQ